ncbi:MAG: histidine ammonia-lyase [Sphingomonadales bacterium]
MTKNSAHNVTIGSDKASLDDLRAAWRGPGPVQMVLSEADRQAVGASADTIKELIDSGQRVYGVTTGFGSLADQNVAPADLEALQEKLVLSHISGLGNDLPDEVVRLVMVLKVLCLARGYSGARIEIVEALIKLLAAGIYPAIPEKGSVGASGDLAPLASLAGFLIGVGEGRQNGERVTAAEGLDQVGIEAIRLGPKEGLALLNGTQVSTALALTGLFRIENVFAAAITAGALSVDAARGSDTPFDPRLHAARGHPGQIAVAAALRGLLRGSEIRNSHEDCGKVQDPYCLRCQPQVMGAILDTMHHAARVLLIEAGAVSDNPLVFAETGEVLSGGNFHAEPVALVADMLALAAAEIGSISERRTALLMDKNLSGLPAFLVRNPGLNSGFMNAQVAAAALVSENKMLAHPASVDSIPTSANQEDHVSMATHGARRLLEMADNAANVIAIELLCAAQGIEFHHGLKTSEGLQQVHAIIRDKVPSLEEDRVLTPDIEAVADLIKAGAFYGFTGALFTDRDPG